MASAQSFFDHFLKPEYLVPVSEFPASSGGDLFVTYYQVQIPSFANGELLIIGEFPRATFFSITAYDDHGAIVGTFNDFELQPYGSSQNPYSPGGPAGAEDILYALKVKLGAPNASNPNPACQTPLSVQNFIDATVRHTTTEFYSSQQANFSATVSGVGSVTHDNAPNTTGSFLLIRSYRLQSPLSSSQADVRKPFVWLRAASTGCAIQLTTAGQQLPASQWYTLNSILNRNQVLAHVQHEIDLGTQSPFGPDPRSDVDWLGREEYAPGGLIGAYLTGVLPTAPPTLTSQGRVMQMQVRLPALPCRSPLPCPLTGNEELRYWSLTFEDSAGKSIGTITDLSLAPNGSGYATLIVTLGTPVPAHVNLANGYSVVNAALPTTFRLVLRNALPAPAFGCSTANVPPRTAEYHTNGGYLGEYSPVVTFPLALSLPTVAQPVNQNESCVAP